MAQLGQALGQGRPGCQEVARGIESALQHPTAHRGRGSELALTQTIDRGYRAQVPLAAGLERGERFGVFGRGAIESRSPRPDPRLQARRTRRFGPGPTDFPFRSSAARSARLYSVLAASGAGLGAGAGFWAAAGAGAFGAGAFGA